MIATMATISVTGIAVTIGITENWWLFIIINKRAGAEVGTFLGISQYCPVNPGRQVQFPVSTQEESHLGK